MLCHWIIQQNHFNDDELRAATAFGVVRLTPQATDETDEDSTDFLAEPSTITFWALGEHAQESTLKRLLGTQSLLDLALLAISRGVHSALAGCAQDDHAEHDEHKEENHASQCHRRNSPVGPVFIRILQRGAESSECCKRHPQLAFRVQTYLGDILQVSIFHTVIRFACPSHSFISPRCHDCGL